MNINGSVLCSSKMVDSTDQSDKSLESMEEQDEQNEITTRALFNIEDKPEFLLRLSETRHFIIKGELSDSSRSERKSTAPTGFSKTIRELVRNVILEFKNIKKSEADIIRTIPQMPIEDPVDFNMELLDMDNFLFYIIRNESESSGNTMKVLLSLPGSGRCGKKWCSAQFQIYHEKLKVAIKRLGNTGYGIEGIFVPFSTVRVRTITNTFDHPVRKIERTLSERKDSFMKHALIAKILRERIEKAQTTMNSLKTNDLCLFKWFADLSEARRSTEKIRQQIGRVYGLGDPEEFLESLILHSLEKIEEDESILETYSGDSTNQENVEKCRDQNSRMYFQPYEERREDINDVKHLYETISEFRQCLKMLWRRSKAIGFSDLFKHQAQCSEDNLIDYLIGNSNILREGGIHYIFNVANSIKETHGKEIRIRPPCSYCFTQFPLKFEAIDGYEIGSRTHMIRERVGMKMLSEIIDDGVKQFEEHYKKRIVTMNRNYLGVVKCMIDKVKENKTDLMYRGLMETFSQIQSAGSSKKEPETLEESLSESFKCACKMGNYEIVEFFIGNTGNSNLNHFLSNIFYDSIEMGHRDVAILIFNVMMKQDEKKFGSKCRYTALHYMSLYNFPNLIKSLMGTFDWARKAQAINVGVNSWTPMKIAVISGHAEVVTTLLAIAHEIDEELKLNISIVRKMVYSLYSRGKSWKPIHLAALIGHEVILETLLKEGKEKSYMLVHATAVEGWTPLHCAASENRVGAVKILLEEKADIGAVTDDGSNVFHLAARNGCGEAIETIMEYAKKHPIGSDVIKLLNSKCGENELTPLHMAATGNWFDVVQYLCCYPGVNLNAKTKDGHTSLHIASEKGFKKCVEVLLEEGAEIDVRTPKNLNALHLAAKRGLAGIVEMILEHAEIYFDLEQMEDFVGKENYEITSPSLLEDWYKRFEDLKLVSRGSCSRA